MLFKKKEGLPPHLQNKSKLKPIIIISFGIIVILILVFAGVTLLTGKIIKDEGIAEKIIPKEPTTELAISPDPLTRGNYMTITMKSGKTGTDEIVSITNEAGWKVVDNLNMNCNGPTCFNETIIKIYKSSTDWEPGVYRIVAKDYATPEIVTVEKIFTVIV